MEAIKRSKVDLSLGGTNWARNRNTQGEGCLGGVLGYQAELDRVGCAGIPTGTGRSAWAQTPGRRVGVGGV